MPRNYEHPGEKLRGIEVAVAWNFLNALTNLNAGQHPLLSGIWHYELVSVCQLE